MCEKDRKIRRVPTESLLPSASVDPERVVRYASMHASTQPPIEVINGYAVDGNHRLFAALRRGDTEITVVDSNLSPKQKRKWLQLIGG